ncbi:tyrosine-type recombinase/integrase [Rhodopirellula bahusiensis]|uniref:tyrosine-type recombinase/integrase n=1 Tax=Rhodopirellula bahusiensis TaxID=2014065 RepID=UPI0032970AE5
MYLDFVESNRSPATYDRCRNYVSRFVLFVGRSRLSSDVVPADVHRWIDDHNRRAAKIVKDCATDKAKRRLHTTKKGDTGTIRKPWGPTAKRDAIGVVKRMYNWAVEEGHIAASPLAQVKRPKASNRQIVYTDAQWIKVRSHADEHLGPILDFLKLTGCRPFEARSLEARHVHHDLIVFPPTEAKGELQSRVIVMVDEVRATIEPRLEQYPTGALFRNSRGDAWSKSALRSRLYRLGDKLGIDNLMAYGFRHTYTTNSLIQGVDTVSLSHLLGHSSTRMVSEVYGHLSQNFDHLRQQAARSVLPLRAN